MRITALTPQMTMARAESTPAPSEQPAPEPKGDSFLSTVGKGVAGLGGAAVGYAGARLATTAATTVFTGTGSVPGLLPLTQLAMPEVQASQALLGLLQNGLVTGLVVGALVGTVAAVGAGAVVAYHAADGAQLKSPTAEIESQGLFGGFGAELHQSGAEMRAQMGQVVEAETIGQAAKAGAFAGASIGGPVGAYAGRFQGMLLGAATGALVTLPLMAQFHPALGLLGVAVGGMTGAAIGEPVGHLAGSVAAGAIGAVAGAGYHAVTG